MSESSDPAETVFWALLNEIRIDECFEVRVALLYVKP
jgi:hypothetical protein